MKTGWPVATFLRQSSVRRRGSADARAPVQGGIGRRAPAPSFAGKLRFNGPVADRSRLRQALAANGTVTGFLERLVGERIDAHAHHHQGLVTSASNDLGAREGEPLLQRAATLRGRVSGTSYVYAETGILTDRLPAGFCLRLETTNDPIGRILDETGVAVTRENLTEPEGLVAPRLNGAVDLGDCLLTRTYRLDAEQIPLMVVTEWFLPSLQPFLSPA